MKKLCAWCGIEMPGSPPDGGEELQVSHGICDDCAHPVLARLGMSLDEYLEGLAEPVVVVDSDAVVLGANRAARELLGKELDEIKGECGGPVFECEYSRLPGGCGHTVHCTGCVIRGTVSDSYRNGVNHRHVPAVLTRQSSQIRFLITTVSAGDHVLLRLEEIEPQSDADHDGDDRRCTAADELVPRGTGAASIPTEETAAW